MAKAGNLPDAPNDYAMAIGLPDGTSANMIYSSLGLAISPDNDWHYMSVAVDRVNGDVRFVLDNQVDLQLGVLNDPMTDYSGIDNNDPLYIGAHPAPFDPVNRPNSANWGFDGNIDELRISNTFLAESELLVVPEPATIALAIAGVVALGVITWARTRAFSTMPKG